MERTTGEQTQIIKLLVMFAAILLCALLLTGVCLTIVHNALLKKQNQVNANTSLIEQQLEEHEADKNFLQTENGEIILGQN